MLEKCIRITVKVHFLDTNKYLWTENIIFATENAFLRRQPGRQAEKRPPPCRLVVSSHCHSPGDDPGAPAIVSTAPSGSSNVWNYVYSYSKLERIFQTSNFFQIVL